jgi:CubicO group peptidase (beta-lactamase class C family)
MGPMALVGLGGLLSWRSFNLPLWLRFAIPIVIPAAMFTAWQTGVIGSLDDMALGWHLDRLDKDDTKATDWALWHNGGTAGYASYLAFSRQYRTGVVLLANSGHEPDSTGRATLTQLLNQPPPATNSVVPPG